jgi:hypothetical protein
LKRLDAAVAAVAVVVLCRGRNACVTGNFNGCKRHVARDTSSALLLLIPLQTHLRVSAVSSSAFLHVCLHQVAFAMDITHVLPAPASPRRPTHQLLTSALQQRQVFQHCSDIRTRTPDAPPTSGQRCKRRGKILASHT